MIVSIFKNNNPASFIILPLFAMVLWMIPFLHPPSFVPQQIMPFFGFIILPLLNFPILASVLALVLILIGAFLLNYICNQNEILVKQSFLPALFYIILMSISTTIQLLHPLIFSNLFILLAIHVLLDSYRKDSAFSSAFNAGIFVSISTLFYFPSIFNFPLIVIALIIIRPFNWREWVISFLGIVVPFAFLLTYYFWNDKLFLFLQNVQSFFRFVSFSSGPQLTLYQYLPLLIGALLLIIALISIWNLSSNSQRSKKSIRLLFWLVFLNGISFMVVPSISIYYFSTLAIPIAVFYANYFLSAKKKKWAEFLFILFITAIVFQQVYNFL